MCLSHVDFVITLVTPGNICTHSNRSEYTPVTTLHVPLHAKREMKFRTDTAYRRTDRARQRNLTIV